MSENSTTFFLAAGMGVLAGMRSMAAPALVSRKLARRKRRGYGGTAERLLASPRAASSLRVLAVGEMIADKTPWIPDRTELSSVFGRALSGALSGAAIAGRTGSSRVLAGLIGSAAAVGATFASYNVRRDAGRWTDLPDPVLGLVEDAVVYTAGRRMVSELG